MTISDTDIYKLKYTIAKNRFCENIGRQHKSNGVIIEADLTRGYLSQMCFDPDCRGLYFVCFTLFNE